MFTVHPVLTMHVALRDGVLYMEKGDKPDGFAGEYQADEQPGVAQLPWRVSGR